MEGLIATGQAILTAMQALGLITAAISIGIGAYYLIVGGEQGRRKAVQWFIGAAVGLVILMGASAIASGIDQNIKF